MYMCTSAIYFQCFEWNLGQTWQIIPHIPIAEIQTKKEKEGEREREREREREIMKEMEKEREREANTHKQN